MMGVGGGIVYDARKLKAFDGLLVLGEYAKREQNWLDELWQFMLAEPELMDEFMYYLDHHMLKDQMKREGFGLTDLYMHQMDRYNLIRDIGKNTESCNKEYLVLGAFHEMGCLIRKPEETKKRLNDSPGADRSF